MWNKWQPGAFLSLAPIALSSFEELDGVIDSVDYVISYSVCISYVVVIIIITNELLKEYVFLSYHIIIP